MESSYVPVLSFVSCYSINQWFSIKNLLFIIINLVNLSSTKNHYLTTCLMNLKILGTSALYHISYMILPPIKFDLVLHQLSNNFIPSITHRTYHILKCTSFTPDDTFLHDLDASGGLTPFKSDFFDYVDSYPWNLKVDEVIVTGTSICRFVDTKGWFVYLPQVTCHLSSIM